MIFISEEWDLRKFFIDDPYEEEYLEAKEEDTLFLDDSNHQPPKNDILKIINDELKKETE